MRVVLVSLFALAGATPAFAQRVTEQFIPIGQSPGALTMIGEVMSAPAPPNAEGQTSVAMTSSVAPNGVAYGIDSDTRIYIDRSEQGQPNTLGEVTDIQPGRTVEIAIAAPTDRTAEWVKVEAPH